MFAGKKLLFLLFFSLPLQAETLFIKISPWTAQCRDLQTEKELNCGLPVGFEKGIEEFILKTADDRLDELRLYERSISFGTNNKVAKLKVFEVPKSDAHPRYFQLQFIWLEGNRSECHISVSAERNHWPPMTCVEYLEKKAKKFGMLLELKRFKPHQD